MSKAPLLLSLLLAFPLAAEKDPWAESYRLEAQKQYAQAAQALSGLPQNLELLQLRQAYLAYLQGRYEDSVAGYRRAMAAFPQSLDAQLGLTLPLLALRRWEEAALVARKVIDQCAWNYWAHVRLLVAEEGLQQWKALAIHGQELAKRYPSDPTAFTYWARGEAHAGRSSEARQAYRRVLQLYPAHKEALEYVNRHR